MGHSWIITRLWCHLYKLLLPDLSQNSTFILKNSANNSIFASVLDSRSSNSTSIHQFYYSASTRLRAQTFTIRLDDESQVGTPLRLNLLLTFLTFCRMATSRIGIRSWPTCSWTLWAATPRPWCSSTCPRVKTLSTKLWTRSGSPRGSTNARSGRPQRRFTPKWNEKFNLIVT